MILLSAINLIRDYLPPIPRSKIMRLKSYGFSARPKLLKSDDLFILFTGSPDTKIERIQLCLVNGISDTTAKGKQIEWSIICTIDSRILMN